jgi:hypothetical protein
VHVSSFFRASEKRPTPWINRGAALARFPPVSLCAPNKTFNGRIV